MTLLPRSVAAGSPTKVCGLATTVGTDVTRQQGRLMSGSESVVVVGRLEVYAVFERTIRGNLENFERPGCAQFVDELTRAPDQGRVDEFSGHAPGVVGGPEKTWRLRIKTALAIPTPDPHSVAHVAFKQLVRVAGANRKGRPARVKLPFGRRGPNRLNIGSDTVGCEVGGHRGPIAQRIRRDGKVARLRSSGMPGENRT